MEQQPGIVRPYVSGVIHITVCSTRSCIATHGGSAAGERKRYLINHLQQLKPGLFVLALTSFCDRRHTASANRHAIITSCVVESPE